MAFQNCLTYLKERGHLTFAEAPFCDIDNLILSMCAYGELEDFLPGINESTAVPFRDAVTRLTARPGWDHTGVVMAREIPTLLAEAARSPRFGPLPVGCCESIFDEGEGVQFAAFTWFLPDGTLYLSYRGTDDTLIGWQECFRMSYAFPIPAQKLAEDYLNSVASRHPGRLRLGGHSKGGNLAVWASLHADPQVRSRILRVYSNDGPGFTHSLTHTRAYRALSGRMVTFVPQSSVVGPLLHPTGSPTILYSRGHGLVRQHDPFTWQVEGTSFRTLPRFSRRGRFSAAAIHNWLETMSPEELAQFVEVLFSLLSANRAHTLTDIKTSPGASTLAAGKSYRALPPAQRRQIHRYLGRMVRALHQRT